MPVDDKKLQRVAVVIPCHNHANYVVKAISSVFQQTVRPTCIVVVDDGSTDESSTKIQQVMNELDPRDRLVHFLWNEKPTGPSAARNKAIKYAWDNVDYFCMLDADDLYEPTKIEKSLAIASQDERIGLVYSDANIVNEKLGTSVREYREPYNRVRLLQECIVSNTPLVSKLALQTVGLYDEEMRTAEDWDLWLRITRNFIAVHIPEALHMYRVTGQNSSDTVPHEVWVKNWQLIRQRHG